MAGFSAAPASAQSWFAPWGGWERGWDYERPRRRYRERQRRAEPQRPVAPVKPPPGPVVAIVSLADQSIHVYGGDELIAQSRVSTGARGYRTPTGVFSVIQKRRYHESNIYSGAPMPWMQRLTWSGIALHGGEVPNYPASHGCIRLTYNFAPQLWQMTRIGARVIVSPREVAPVAIAHPRLPAPRITPADANVSSAGDGLTPVAVVASRQERGGSDAEVRPDATSSVVPGVGALEAPKQRARAARAEAAAKAKAAAAALKPALAEARKTAREARKTSVALRRAKSRLAIAERRMASATRAVERAQENSKAAERALKTETAARATLEAARTALAEAEAADATASQAADEASAAVKAAVAARDRTAQRSKDLANSLDPISIFVSRKEGRVFIRQGMAPLLEGAVTIRDPDRPLGTHVFTAIAEEDDGARLRWSVVTVPDGDATYAPAEALDRIEIAGDVSRQIGDRLWTGASLIVSDQGISRETGVGTDFVVLTKP